MKRKNWKWVIFFALFLASAIGLSAAHGASPADVNPNQEYIGEMRYFAIDQPAKAAVVSRRPGTDQFVTKWQHLKSGTILGFMTEKETGELVAVLKKDCGNWIDTKQSRIVLKEYRRDQRTSATPTFPSPPPAGNYVTRDELKDIIKEAVQEALKKQGERGYITREEFTQLLQAIQKGQPVQSAAVLPFPSLTPTEKKCLGIGTIETGVGTFMTAAGLVIIRSTPWGWVAVVGGAVLSVLGILDDESDPKCKAIAGLAGGLGGLAVGFAVDHQLQKRDRDRDEDRRRQEDNRGPGPDPPGDPTLLPDTVGQIPGFLGPGVDPSANF